MPGQHRTCPTAPAPGTHRVEGSGTFRAGVGVILARRGSLACGDRRDTEEVFSGPRQGPGPHTLPDTYLRGGLFKEGGGG